VVENLSPAVLRARKRWDVATMRLAAARDRCRRAECEYREAADAFAQAVAQSLGDAMLGVSPKREQP